MQRAPALRAVGSLREPDSWQWTSSSSSRLLIAQVRGLPGSLCADCAMLRRPNVSPELGAGHDDPVPGTPPLPAGPRSHRRGLQPAVANAPPAPGAVHNGARDVGRPCLRRLPPDRHVRPALGTDGRPLLRQVPLRVRPGAAGRDRGGPRCRWCRPGPRVSPAWSSGASPWRPCCPSATGLPAYFVRKEPKKYGTEQVCEGGDVAGRRLLIVEDVVTTGGQIVLSAQDLRAEGAVVRARRVRHRPGRWRRGRRGGRGDHAPRPLHHARPRGLRARVDHEGDVGTVRVSARLAPEGRAGPFRRRDGALRRTAARF